ncbi:6220_t:CDS:2 [Ambispora gerdemannii]|uniref:6220_t:CDS:1 n=1 Tax=Ambispora gerdemannii TaxID=144530 RepID=A0A9N8YJJ6_9GLOM|nr:6220_t:CDS:2 [Ambispora gerdemannii]
MSLVADYDSDSGSEREEASISEQTQKTLEPSTSEKKNTLCSTLPPPKNRVTATITSVNTTSSKNKKRAEGPVKIFVDLPNPSEKDNLDSDSGDEEREAKRLKFGTSGRSGLFSLLPAPTRPISSKVDKNNNKSEESSVKTVKTTSFVPHTLSRQKSATAAKPTKDKNDESSQNDEEISFFPLGPEISNIVENKYESISSTIISTNPIIGENDDNYNVSSTSSIPMMTGEESPTDHTSIQTINNNEQYYYGDQWTEDNSYMYTASASYGAGVSGVDDSWQLQQQQEESEIALNEEIIAKLGGRRNKKEREAGAIQIKEIDARDQLGDDAWHSQMAQLTKPGQVSSGAYSHLKPSKGQKRKHNLMYLVHQATVMENELKEQYANNRKTKRETQAKYGF